MTSATDGAITEDTMNKLLLLEKAIAAANTAYKAAEDAAYDAAVAVYNADEAAAKAVYDKAIDAAAAEYHKSKEDEQ